MFSFGGGFLGGDDTPVSYITDLFNGFNRVSGDSFTGGPTVVRDNSGALITPPLNRMGIEGGRLSYDLAEGATLGPELLTAERSQFDNGWGITGESTVSGGVGRVLSSAGVYSDINIGGLLTLGKRYRVSYEVLSATGQMADPPGTIWPAVVGTNVVPTYAPVTTTALTFKRVGVTDIVLDNVSVREVLPIWLPAITPAHYVRTRKGSVAKFDSAFKGFLNEPARTNKVTCRKHNPVDTSNITKTGDSAAVLALADELPSNLATAVDAQGRTVDLRNICTNFKVYKVDNSAGATAAYAMPAGATGNTNPCSYRIFARCTGAASYLRLSNSSFGVSATAAIPATYSEVKRENVTPLAGDTLQIQVAAGSVVYFILPQLEEGSFCTSIIPGDTLATVTRAATVYSRPTAGVLRANDWGVWGRVVPSASAATQAANNMLFAFSASIYVAPTSVGSLYAQVAAGVACTIPAISTAAVFEYMFFKSSAYGIGVRFKPEGGVWTDWQVNVTAAAKADTAVATSYEVGSRSGLAQFAGNYPFTAIIQHSDPKGELERLSQRYP